MPNFKAMIVIFAVLAAIVLLLPTLLVAPFSKEKAPASKSVPSEAALNQEEEEIIQHSPMAIAVYRSQTKQIEEIPLEEYVNGVVASEMPADFELEALKAQALTARTYIVKQLMNQDPVGLPKGSVVTDTVMHQVYKSPAELKKLWGSQYQTKLNKIKKAVKATEGMILTYEGTPITASFFSTSNGYTENSEDYWQNAFPYLRSVPSPWDEASPKYTSKQTLPISEFERKLGVKLVNGQLGTVLKRTAGKSIALVKVGDKTFSGRDIRTALNLKSTDFTWERKGNNIMITTKGYGHGVGMSQYGANGMAQEGKNYADIVNYYYKGIAITKADPYVQKFVVKK